MYRPANKPHFQRAYASKELLRCNVVLKCKGRYAIGFQIFNSQNYIYCFITQYLTQTHKKVS